jgi:hypothetical protein
LTDDPVSAPHFAMLLRLLLLLVSQRLQYNWQLSRHYS